MESFTHNERLVLVQYAIQKYENEEELLQRLETILDAKGAQQVIDTLIGTQRVRRIGPEILQNNQSHTELPELPDKLKPIIDKL